MFIAGSIAEAHGCTMNQGGIQPCVVNGVDRGQLLATMFVLGWLMIATLPAAAIAILVWLIVLIAHWTASRRTQRSAA